MRPRTPCAACLPFQFDCQWEDDPGFVFYDFHHPEDVPHSLRRQFDYVVADPPYITEPCWKKYARTARLLLRSSSDTSAKVLAASVDANEALLRHEFPGMRRCAFRPCMPTLMYQYSFFTNYCSTHLEQENPEIVEFGPRKGLHLLTRGHTSSSEHLCALQ